MLHLLLARRMRVAVEADLGAIEDGLARLPVLSRCFAALGQRLDDLIDRHAGDLGTETALSVQHCLMKDYSLQAASRHDVYAAWWADAQEKGSVR